MVKEASTELGSGCAESRSLGGRCEGGRVGGWAIVRGRRGGRRTEISIAELVGVRPLMGAVGRARTELASARSECCRPSNQREAGRGRT